MKLPAADRTLEGGILVPAHALAPGAWQEHLVKHPLFGLLKASSDETLDPLARNTEGWDRLEPPAMSPADRLSLVRVIRAASGGRCLVPEILGTPGRTLEHAVPCFRSCAPSVRDRCGHVCDAHPVSLGYAAVTEALLDAVSPANGVRIGAPEFIRAICPASLHRPDTLTGLAVMSFGVSERNRRDPIVRISRADGVRTELFFGTKTAGWRTTYRERLVGPGARLQFLADFPPKKIDGALSDRCVVGRVWWETYGR